MLARVAGSGEESPTPLHTQRLSQPQQCAETPHCPAPVKGGSQTAVKPMSAISCA